MFWLWALLTMLLQQPLLAAVVVLVLWFAVDRARFQRTSPMQWLRKRGAVAKLRAATEINPHDRDARFRLAQLLVDRGEHDEALALIEKNIAAGDRDDETLFVAGTAAFGASAEGSDGKAEDYLARARATGSSFRNGAIELALGRGRLAAGRLAEAREALDAAIKAQPGSVEAHVLLSRAQAGLGKTDDARATKQQAWKLYLESPRFKRRQVRAWAWRANPAAASRYFALIAGVAFAVVILAPKLLASIPDYEPDYDETYPLQVDGFNVDVAHAPAADRFEITAGAAIPIDQSPMPRWDLNDNEIVDLEHKLAPGDAICRLLTHYPALAAGDPTWAFAVHDRQTNRAFSFRPLALAYYASAEARASVWALEALLESRPPQDCSYVAPGEEIRYGVRGGVAFVEPM